MSRRDSSLQQLEEKLRLSGEEMLQGQFGYAQLEAEIQQLREDLESTKAASESYEQRFEGFLGAVRSRG